MEEKKAACLQKAGSDEGKKANCEKRFAAKSQKSMDKSTDKMTGQKDDTKK